MKRMLVCPWWIAFLVILGCWCGVSAGQTFQGSFTGIVSDPSGAIIVGAMVRVEEVSTGLIRETTTLDDGRYSVALLPPGQYRIAVERQGFERVIQGPFPLTVNQQLRVDFEMKLGVQTSTVEVKERPPVLDTVSSSVGTTVEQAKIAEIPLNGRHFLELTTLGPGIVPGTPGSRINDRGGAINVNGMRDSMNSYWLDGLDNTAIGVGQFTVVPPLDSVQEFRMETGGYEAKFGAHAGAQVNVVTRSGSNRLHGSLHEFFENTSLDARSFFDSVVAPVHRNQFGGALGGPVVVPQIYDGHDRTFFYFAYEGLRDRHGFFNRAVVPTDAERNGDFSDLLAPNCAQKNLLIDPFALFAGQVQPLMGPGGVNTLPFIDPVGQALVNLYPHANIPNAPCGTPNFVSLVNRQVNQNNFFGRVDQHWGTKDNVFFRINVNRDQEFLPPNTSSRAASTNLPGFATITHDQYLMTGIDWSHVFSPSLINELKLGYNRWQIRETIQDQGNTIAKQLGLQGINPAFSGVPLLNFTNYDGIGSNDTDPQNGAVNTFQIADTLTHVHRNHALAYGADIRSVDRGNFTLQTLTRGQYNFTGTVTGGFGQLPAVVGQGLGCVSPGCSFGNSIADALLGIPTFWVSGFTQNISGHIGEYDFFGQDTWKVRPNLTLILGVRYEYKGLATDRLNRFGNFDFQKGLLMLASDGPITEMNFDPTTMSFVPVGTTSLGSRAANRSLQLPDRDDFAPRVGFSWQPFHKSYFVVRGGYGIFYNQTIGDVFFLKTANPPFVQINAGNIGGALQALQTGAIIPGSGQLIQQALAGIVAPTFPTVSPFQINFQDAAIHEWNVDLQGELPGSWLLDLGYVGTRGLHLPREVDPNQPRPNPNTQTAPVPFPLFGGFSHTESSASSSYHSMQVKVERHYVRGLSFLGAYTYSKSIDDASDSFATSRSQNFPQNSNNLAAEKARSDFDFRHRLVLSYVYELPYRAEGRTLSNKPLFAVVRDWQISGIFTAQSGPVFTPQVSGNFSQADEQNVIGVGSPTDRPNVTGSALYAGQQTPNQWVLRSAFSAPSPFTFGNAGRNILTGPKLTDWDFALSRKFLARESKSLEFRAEVFNLMNHPNFDIPVRDLASANFGVITRTLGPVAGPASGGPGLPRQVQFGLKYAW
ncbi:MAG: TonB-dependent receptor [Acidobacteriia bacterium]|nr:TonB-dependent receptor [Terriglobia bacterium]